VGRARVREYRLAQGQARQAKSKKENKYVIKVMRFKLQTGKGIRDSVPEVRQNQRMYQAFSLGMLYRL
jgi:hypothetical protein